VRAGLEPGGRVGRRPVQDARQDFVDGLGHGGQCD
jgi:hypothetical protein